MEGSDEEPPQDEEELVIETRSRSGNVIPITRTPHLDELRKWLRERESG